MNHRQPQGWSVDEDRMMEDQVDFQQAYYACQQAAIDAGALEPQGIAERMAAGVMASSGQRWADCQRARQRLEEWTRDCLRKKGFDV